jgi:hypothetical protein
MARNALLKMQVNAMGFEERPIGLFIVSYILDACAFTEIRIVTRHVLARSSYPKWTNADSVRDSP